MEFAEKYVNYCYTLSNTFVLVLEKKSSFYINACDRKILAKDITNCFVVCIRRSCYG
jgi:hypothetical protein